MHTASEPEHVEPDAGLEEGQVMQSQSPPPQAQTDLPKSQFAPLSLQTLRGGGLVAGHGLQCQIPP